MAGEDLKKRIEALNKKPLHNLPDPGREESPEIGALRRKLKKQSANTGGRIRLGVESSTPENQTVSHSGATPPAEIIYSRNMPIHHKAPPQAPYSETRDFGPAITLEEAVEGIVREAPAGPGYYHIEAAAVDLEQNAELVHRRFTWLTGHPDGKAVPRIAHTCNSDCIAPQDVIFLDLETTGLSMTPVFLIGTMECTPDGFVFHQYFARDYSEEISILTAFAERLNSAQMVVTFNGKTFDLPFLKNRAVAHRLKMPEADSHLDLLHEARRLYRGQLPNCKLQTLEEYICGRKREDDIPGAQIPQAYHDFVRTGNANKIGLILMHNLYDLLTMADLMHQMWHRE